MTLQTQALLEFRRKWAKRYFFWGCSCGVLILLFFFLYACIGKTSVSRSLLTGLGGLSFILCLDIFFHRHNILLHLNPQHGNAVERIENYLTVRFSKWENGGIKRAIAGALLLIAVLLCLFFARESKWAYITSSLLICFVLYNALKNWMNFQDQITLHDIRRSLRDQTPDTST